MVTWSRLESYLGVVGGVVVEFVESMTMFTWE